MDDKIRKRIAELLMEIEKDFLAEDEEHGFSWINSRIEELVILSNEKFTNIALLELANSHYEHSLIAQTFYTEHIAQMRRERGEL
ncbi:hypothetical protein [Priestia megaterium]|uniref:hypothetical protein n=1 Tax=Priestia megaterium TaxID=1404 RepID=UPI000BFC5954|nr:hypothetical protein [Priestia megaterium]MUL29482.1 hypothetical protein [Priestia megaterium]PGR91077.1 hypothetical protein COC61_23430 [Priestia megaterium]